MSHTLITTTSSSCCPVVCSGPVCCSSTYCTTTCCPGSAIVTSTCVPIAPVVHHHYVSPLRTTVVHTPARVTHVYHNTCTVNVPVVIPPAYNAGKIEAELAATRASMAAESAALTSRIVENQIQTAKLANSLASASSTSIGSMSPRSPAQRPYSPSSTVTVTIHH